MKILPFISLFFIAILATSSLAAAEYITPERSSVTEYMNNYNLHDQNNSLQLACEIGQYVSEEYGWNCDIRQLNFTKRAPVYINVFYPEADNKKGYEAYYGWFGPQKKEVTGFTTDKKMYYRDWYEQGHECYMSGVCSYGTVKSYWGNVTSIDPEENVTENESTDPISNDTEDVDVYDNSFVNYEEENTTTDNSTTVEAVGNTNTVTNSTGTINNQGYIGKAIQYCLDFSDAHLSNVTFNFWGN